MKLHQVFIQVITSLLTYPSISASDLTNAWSYEEVYSNEIEAAIQKHQEA
ncbi:MAG: hypothetical protein KME64_31730 [Scytonematopsis contorta HA4267-MV1]|jgi:uncharacterized protein (DUF433 family)|nr:hypothetical protein [Scytonematopsis contorta HA4267-MV1]